MQFIKLLFKPGLYTDGTSYSNEGSWVDGDKVRFRKEFVEKIGGWVKFINDGFVGKCRNIHNWATNSAELHLGIGTTSKIYVILGAEGDPAAPGYSATDITPIRRANQSVTVDTLLGNSLVVVTDAGHGAGQGDYVTLSGASDTDLNQEHRISALGDRAGDLETTKYTIQIDNYTSASNASIAATADYQTNVGSDVALPPQGWGDLNWGDGPWGGSEGVASSTSARVWNMDNYGDDLLINLSYNKIYYWDESAGGRAIALNDKTRKTSTFATATATGSTLVTIEDEAHGVGVGDTVTITSSSTVDLIGTWPVGDVLTSSSYEISITGSITVADESISVTYVAGTAYCPTKAIQVLTSERARHVIAFGCNPIGSIFIDRLFVRWSSSEDPTTWQPLSTNSAGGQDLSSGSEIIGALSTRLETLIWTDTALTSMRYVGAPFYFSFNDVGRGMSMVGPNASANANGVVYFMDRGSFYVYSGSVQRLRCPILNTVFDDFNYDESAQVSCGTNLDFSEVIWFYPSATSTENDRYVVYNYDQQVWYYGSLSRGAWDNAAVRPYPKASSLNTVSLGSDPITTTNLSPNVTITSTAHGLSDGDSIILTGSSAVGGLSELVLNTQHIVTDATSSANSYAIDVGTIATSTTTGGGGDVSYEAPNYIYSHEVGWDDDGSAMTSYIESGDFDLADGDRYLFLSRILPDLKFIDAAASDAIKITMNGRDFPLESQDSPPLSESTFTTSSRQSHIRGRARQASMKVESTGLGYGWRLGHVRVDLRQDGKR